MPPRSLAAQSQAPAGSHWSAPSMTGASTNAVQPAFTPAVPHPMGQADRRMLPIASGSAVLANAEPPRGGSYDRHFPWSAKLLEENHKHFKNPSFRGCQEQVTFLTLPVHALVASRIVWLLRCSTAPCDAGHECCALWQGCVCSNANWGYAHINQLAFVPCNGLLDTCQHPVSLLPGTAIYGVCHYVVTVRNVLAMLL